MTSLFTLLPLAGALLAMPFATAAAAQPVGTAAPVETVTTPPEVATLEQEILERVRAFNGISGIAVKSIDAGWEAGWRSERLFPQQSVSKMWVALTVMDAVDRGEIDLTRRVTLGRDDLTLWSSSTRDAVLRGGYTKTLDSLLYDAIVSSDNHANDKLLREVGGPEAVRAMVENKGLGAIRFGDGERLMQAKIAGLTWDPSFSLGNNFSRARARLPDATRAAAFNRYIDDPYDGAAPMAIARALAKLERGEILSAASTAKLLTTMGMTRTGRLRVKGALKPGWTWTHKTGTGQNYRGRVGGLNDIGILTAPDGTSYALAVMTIPNATDGSAQELMRDIGAMVIRHHERHERGGFSI